MRLGVRVGPLILFSGRLGCAPWVVAFLMLIVVVALAIDHPAAAVVVGLVTVGLLVATGRAVSGRRVRAAASRLAYERSIVAYVPCPACEHPTSHQPGCPVGQVEVQPAAEGGTSTVGQ